MERVNTLYLTVAIIVLVFSMLAWAMDLAFDDEVQQQALYCEMTTQGYWPRNASVGCEPDE